MFLNVIIAEKLDTYRKIVLSEIKLVLNAGNRDTLDGNVQEEGRETNDIIQETIVGRGSIMIMIRIERITHLMYEV